MAALLDGEVSQQLEDQLKLPPKFPPEVCVHIDTALLKSFFTTHQGKKLTTVVCVFSLRVVPWSTSYTWWSLATLAWST